MRIRTKRRRSPREAAAGALLLTLVFLAADPAGGGETGSLRILGEPGVDVEWEGVSLGTIPPEGELLVEEIPPGDYSLTVSRPDHHPRSYRIAIDTGPEPRTMRVAPLEPIDPPAAEPLSTPEPATPADPEPAPRAQTPPDPLEDAPRPATDPPATETGPLAADSAPLAADPTREPAATSGPLPPSWLLVTGILLGGFVLGSLVVVALGARLRRRDPGDEADTRPRVDRHFPAVGRRDRQAPDTARLREELERRERELDWDRHRVRDRGEAEVIDLRDFDSGEPRKGGAES